MQEVDGINKLSSLEETNLFRMAVKKFEPTGKFSTYAVENAVKLVKLAKMDSREKGLTGIEYYKSMEDFIKDYKEVPK